MSKYKCDSTCDICHGAGYFAYDVPPEHPGFGKMHMCPNTAKHTWNDYMGFPELDAAQLNWDKFLPSTSVVQMKEKLITLLERGYGWMFVSGKPGTGKTITTKAATIYAYYKYKMLSYYTTHIGLINWLRASYEQDDGQGEYSRRLKQIAAYKFLVIDELGRDRQTDFAIATFSDILNNRYDGAVNRSTITVLVSNFTPNEIMDAYQCDRINDGRFELLTLSNPSMRPLMNYDKQLELDTAWWQEIGD